MYIKNQSKSPTLGERKKKKTFQLLINVLSMTLDFYGNPPKTPVLTCKHLVPSRKAKNVQTLPWSG